MLTQKSVYRIPILNNFTQILLCWLLHFLNIVKTTKFVVIFTIREEQKQKSTEVALTLMLSCKATDPDRDVH